MPDRTVTAESLVAVSAVPLGLVIVAVALRFYARRHQKASLLADDWLMLPALITFIGACSCVFYAVHLQVVGYSTFEITKEQRQATLERSGKIQISLSLVSIICLGCIKASALFFYKRIFCVAGRKAVLNVIIITLLVIIACWVVIFEFLLAFQCGTHFSAPWDGTQLKYCTRSYPTLQAQATSNLLLDLIVLVLPVYPVIQLQTTRSRKVAIVGIFLLACLSPQSFFLTVGQSAIHRIDPEKYLSRVVFYIILEMGVGLVAVNLPSIWMVFASVAPDALLRSIRSVVSIASFRSGRSRSSRERHDPEPLGSSASSSSVLPLSSTQTGVKSVVGAPYELKPQSSITDEFEPIPLTGDHTTRLAEMQYSICKET
ncbi:hypothetical protein E4U17_007332 [Claviceps sp. LM77 group G4]|nr:hypothetical protein E4U17_007332 [Claviceps sp. LM77 group G4]KAG6073246.1 hypothetical protein E4U33_002966 [Claviceps sp. LM78 group G4]KAG6079955.1 hypothetical protein E4U16_000678 [Claviceps sp. LM84 group G4]